METPLTLEVLTTIQREVLSRVAMGLSRPAIAKERKVSSKTIEYHCMAIMKKLNLWNVVELTHWAIGMGLVDLKFKKVKDPNTIDKMMMATPAEMEGMLKRLVQNAIKDVTVRQREPEPPCIAALSAIPPDTKPVPNTGLVKFVPIEPKPLAPEDDSWSEEMEPAPKGTQLVADPKPIVTPAKSYKPDPNGVMFLTHGKQTRVIDASSRPVSRQERRKVVKDPYRVPLAGINPDDDKWMRFNPGSDDFSATVSCV